MRLVADIALALLLGLFASEALLRVPGLFDAAQGDVGDFRFGARRARVVDEAAGERHRVVCLGDSVTFGAGVSEEEAYPSQLARALDRLAPGRFEVLNFGVTALDSAMARERLNVLLRRLAPETVVLWVGSNDSDVAIEAGGEGEFETHLGALAARSRLASLLLSELQDRRILRTWQFASERPVGAAPLAPRAETEARTRIEHNLDEMARLAQGAGAALLLLKYPGHTPRFRIANDAMARSALRNGLVVLAAEDSIRRLPAEQQQYKWALHPNADMYAAIAEDVALGVLAGERARTP